MTGLPPQATPPTSSTTRLASLTTGVELVNCHRHVSQYHHGCLTNSIPSNVIIRADAARLLGGFPEDPAFRGPAAGEDVCFKGAMSHLVTHHAAFPFLRYRVRSGKDGADLALIDVLEHENVAARFSHVVIGSGDGIFGHSAASLAARGVRITVVSRPGSLSSGLARIAGDVIYLDLPRIATAA